MEAIHFPLNYALRGNVSIEANRAFLPSLIHLFSGYLLIFHSILGTGFNPQATDMKK